MIVVDASVILDLLLGHRAQAIQERLLRADIVAAPSLLDAEVGQVLRRLSLAKTITQSRAHDGLRDFQMLRIRRYPHTPFLESAWTMVSNVTFYDALYVALAARFRVPFLTRDAPLARAARRHCTVEVV